MAYGVLKVNYGSNSITDSARRAAKEFRDAGKRLRTVSTNIMDIGEHTGHGYVSKANAFLVKKAQQYEAKGEALDNFANRASTVMGNAENADRRVADHLEQNYQNFQNITGLRGGFIASLGKLLERLGEFFKDMGKVLAYIVSRTLCPVLAVIDIVNAIKNWYQNLPDAAKYWLKLFGKTVALVLAVAAIFVASGGLATIGAFILAVAAFADLVKAGVVVRTYYQFGPEMAKLYDEMSKEDFTGLVLHDMWGWDADVVSTVFSVIEFAGFVCSGIAAIKSVSEAGYLAELKKKFLTIKDMDNMHSDLSFLKKGIVKLGWNKVSHWKVSKFSDLIKGLKKINGAATFCFNFLVKPWESMGTITIEELIGKLPVISDFYKADKIIWGPDGLLTSVGRSSGGGMGGFGWAIGGGFR